MTSFFEKHPWSIVLGAALFYFFVFFQLPMFNTIGHFVEHDYDLRPVTLGYVSSVYFLAEAIFLIPLAIWIDKYSARWVAMIVMTLCVILTFAFSLTDSVIIIILYHAINGIGNGTAYLVSMKYASRWLPQRWKGLGICLVFATIMLSGIIAQTPFIYLIKMVEWRGAVFVNATVGLVFLLYLILSAKDHPSDATYIPQNLFTNIFSAAKNPQVWLCGFFTTLLGLVAPIFGELWGIRYLTIAKHLTDVQAGNAVSMMFLGLLLGVIFTAWISDMIRRRRPVMLMGNIVALILVAYITFYPMIASTTMIFIFLLLGFFASTNMLAFPTAGESSPPKLTTASFSLVAIVINIAGFFVQPFYGWMIELTHPTSSALAPENFQFAEMILPIAFVVSLIIVLNIKETRCRNIFK